LRTFAAVNTFAVIDNGLTVGDSNSFTGTVYRAGTGEASPAGIGYQVLALDAAGTRYVQYAQDIFVQPSTGLGVAQVIAQRTGLVGFIFYAEPQQSHNAVFENGPVFVYTAAAGAFFTGAHVYGDTVNCILKCAAQEFFDDPDKNFPAGSFRVVGCTHYSMSFLLFKTLFYFFDYFVYCCVCNDILFIDPDKRGFAVIFVFTEFQAGHAAYIHFRPEFFRYEVFKGLKLGSPKQIASGAYTDFYF
jgi:hypothetical protein